MYNDLRLSFMSGFKVIKFFNLPTHFLLRHLLAPYIQQIFFRIEFREIFFEKKWQKSKKIQSPRKFFIFENFLRGLISSTNFVARESVLTFLFSLFVQIFFDIYFFWNASSIFFLIFEKSKNKRFLKCSFLYVNNSVL